MNLLNFKKPYYAVIFSSYRTKTGQAGYDKMAQRMVELSKDQPGFLGIESVRGDDGFGITISYWDSEENIKKWKSNGEHREAQERGRSEWYKSFATRICKIERDYEYDGEK